MYTFYPPLQQSGQSLSGGQVLLSHGVPFVSLMHGDWKSYRSESWMIGNPAGSARITNHLWIVEESGSLKMPLLRWTPSKRAGKPKVI